MKLVRLAVGVAAAGSILLLAGCSSTTVDTPPPTPTPAAATTFTMYGEVQLTDDDLARSGCYTTGGYKDIRPGAAVTITDANGTTVALGELKAGRAVSSTDRDTCAFPFTVDEIPVGSKFYAVEVSHRGKVNIDDEEATQAVKLQIG